MSTAYYWRAVPKTPTGRELRRELICVQRARFYFKGERPGMYDESTEDRGAVLDVCQTRFAHEKVIVDEYGREYTGLEFVALVEANS